MNRLYFRPEYTCGRYNSEKKVALMYNLIEGMSYYFDEYSAVVVGEILSVERNECLDILIISEKTGLDMDSISNFFEELLTIGLLSPSKDKLTRKQIDNYRRKVGELRRNNTQTIEKTTEEKLPFANSNAEMEFFNAVGGVTSVLIELTYNCSERCIHCYNPGATRNDNEQNKRKNREELQFVDYKRIIDELYVLGIVKVCLTGGEAFTKSCVWEIIDYLYQKGIAFDIFTNAILLNNEQLSRLANYYPRVVGISIYSGFAEEHDLITRVHGSWERSMRAVQILSELGVPMQLKCCVMRPNIRNYYRVAEIAREYGATPQFEISITDSVTGDRCASQKLRLPPEMLEIVLRDDNIPLYVGKEAPNFGGQKKLLEINACGAGENSFCITPEGNLQVCVAFPQALGNLKEHTIKEIINNSTVLKTWLNAKLSDYEECGRYDYCNYCNLCAGNNFIAHGTHLKAAENNCYIAKVRYQLAQKIMKGDDPLQNRTLLESLSVLDNTIELLKQDFTNCYSEKSGKRINEVS